MRIKFNKTVMTYIVTFIFLGSIGTVFADQNDVFVQIRTGIDYFKQVYMLISKNYVEDIQPLELMKSGIDGMLEALDPYTVFIEDEGIEALNQITTGKYGGVGMEIGHRDKKVIVVALMPNSPAIRAGILPGDIIIGIGDYKVVDLSSTEISKLLRGKVGTSVELKIDRPVTDETLSFILVRAEIIIEEVPYAGFVQPNTAYIRLTGFSSISAGSVRRAAMELSNKAEIKNVILDLRGNPGGLLHEAVEIVNIFVPRGELVVFTKGRREQLRSYRTDKNPLLPNAKLCILIDEGSASASEIVAGAIQDMDRGVIVGQPSFGKGLVQNIFNIANGKARLKVTTARYYVPSGRCIQKLDYNEQKRQIKITATDNTDEHYKTRNGRNVMGKGGIIPDIDVGNEKLSFFESQLWRGGYFFRFAVYFTAKNKNVILPVEITDAVIDSFYAFVKRDSFEFYIENESAYKKLLKKAKSSDQNKLAAYLEDGLSLFVGKKQDSYEKHSDDIRKALLLEISHNLGGERARIEEEIKYDPVVRKAKTILHNDNSYNLTLAIRDN